MTDDEVRAARARHAAAEESRYGCDSVGRTMSVALESSEDVPALADEVDRLRAALDAEKHQHATVRDHLAALCEWAIGGTSTKLTPVELGERLRAWIQELVRANTLALRTLLKQRNAMLLMEDHAAAGVRFGPQDFARLAQSLNAVLPREGGK